jgi:hypothetical protein
MIAHSNQNWAPGQTVKVGFLSLMVVACIPTPGDFKPDAYLLASKTAFYEFVPHHGLTKLSQPEAARMIADAKRIADYHAARALETARAEADHAKMIFGLDHYWIGVMS